MKFVFCDESGAKIASRRYESFVSVVFDDAVLTELRATLFRAINKALRVPPNKIVQLPVLHGSDMLANLDDDQKLELYDVIFEAVERYSIGFARVGTFHDSVIPGMDPLQASIFNMYFVLQHFYEVDLVTFVYELNIAKHKSIESMYNDQQHHFAFAQLGYEGSSIKHMENIVGRFYGDKRNIFIMIADILGYGLRLRERKAIGPFQGEVRRLFQKVENKCILDYIVYFDDSSKSYQGVSQNMRV